MLASGCSTAGYYAQALGGHLAVLRKSRPVSEWLADPATPAPLRARLELAERMRDYAVAALGLPDNASYRRYADLGRSAVVWNVVAAPELSLTLETWCFPVMGCVGYRGYYDKAAAEALGAELKAQGWEVEVYGVPAYSTLGWSNWLGGDPLLNTFIDWPDGELARLIFHELAHQEAYAADDTMFNESFAVAVQRLGSSRWLQAHGDAAARAADARSSARREDFQALTLAWRKKLQALYTSRASDADKRRRKAELMAAMRADYARMKTERWGGYAGYDAWFEHANNAALGVQAAYNELVPQFEALFEREGGDFHRFYAAVRRLAALPKAERRAELAAQK
ncbi:MAG: aminopeptidase [Burkholderiales bacterium]|nr:aminopeptidase [Burkholderiales bacterium]